MDRPSQASAAVPTAPETDRSEEVSAEPTAHRWPAEPRVSKPARSPSLPLERAALRRLLARLQNPPLRVVLWDGTEIGPHSPPSHTLRISDRGTLWKLVTNPQLQFGEAYSDGRLSIDGDFTGFLRMVISATAGRNSARSRHPSLLRRSKCTRSESKANIHQHYDIGNDFYKLWLDDQMLYTCAYYRHPRMTLEQAQVAKMDHVCRKLQLRPGETVIEAGCGWGGFALHMARHYGVTVRAYNISHEQVHYARDAARRENLDARVEFVEDDWRSIEGSCDAFVSIGMLEHVGLENYRELGHVIRRCLHPAGRGLIHSIGRNFPERLNPWIERRIFPGAQPPTLAQAMDIFEGENFSVLDVENIRLHYAVTCRDWLRRFEDRAADVREMFDERFVRMWRLYLASSMVAFECGTLQLFQILFAPGRSTEVPWTRDYQYVDAPQPGWGDVWRSLAAVDAG